MRRVSLSLAMVAALLAVALPALAATPTTTTAASTKTHSHWFAGSVSAVASNSVSVGVLWTGSHDSSLNGTTVTLTVDGNTQITSGKDRTAISLSDVQVGDLVGVIATGTGSDLSTLTAAKIHVNCNCHWIAGTIDAVGASSIGVQVKKTGPYDTVLAGQSVTLQVNSNTTYIRGKDKTPLQLSDLKVGDGVGVIFGANGFFKAPGFDPSKATFTAKQVHVWAAHQVPPSSTDAAKAATVSA